MGAGGGGKGCIEAGASHRRERRDRKFALRVMNMSWAQRAAACRRDTAQPFDARAALSYVGLLHAITTRS
jgi:hypothetical protein